MMDGLDGALLSAGGGADGAYSLSGVDVQAALQLLWMITFADAFTLVAVLLLVGVVLGGILTRKWSI